MHSYVRFSYWGSAGSMSPSRIGCLHLGHGPNVSGCGDGFRSGSGICNLGRGIRTSRRQHKCRDTKKLLFLKVSVLALHACADICGLRRVAWRAFGTFFPSSSGNLCGPPHMMKSSVQSVGLALRYVHGDCFAVSMVLIAPFFSTRSASLDQSWAILRRAIFRPASKVSWALSTQ